MVFSRKQTLVHRGKSDETITDIAALSVLLSPLSVLHGTKMSLLNPD